MFRAHQLISRRPGAALPDRCAAWCWSGWHFHRLLDFDPRRTGGNCWFWKPAERLDMLKRYGSHELINWPRGLQQTIHFDRFDPASYDFVVSHGLNGSIISSRPTSKLGGLPGQLRCRWPDIVGHAPGKPERHSWVGKAWPLETRAEGSKRKATTKFQLSSRHFWLSS